ncbi:uncharacterized protein CG5098-like [Penaeus monodon]|uniref:uncharacterized protein CG5098-like n=1 Tax=Penaeus monodon TaxID=6687 RepID=UPI0018A7A21C|nr:uncharacterized protein CG5098-like [Penaeus monodon]
MSQAMSHALAHPFLAAHLNPSQLLQVAQTSVSTATTVTTTGKSDVSSPHPQQQQLQVRTDLLEPHPRETETFSVQEPPRPLPPPQITPPEMDINNVRTPPSNASVDSTAAPVKKRRCSPSYLENDTSVSDVIGTISDLGRSDMGGNNVPSVSVSVSGEKSTAHTLSPDVESTPVNGLSATSEAVVKSASGSSSNSQSSLNVSTQNSDADDMLNKNISKNDQDYFNGDHEMLDSPRKRNKKRKSESDSVTEIDYPVVDGQLDESGENKRRTRQKRAISYVEDGTDPVLEMNEDSSPDATPLKKKGRKLKDTRERLEGESDPNPDQQTPVEPASSPAPSAPSGEEPVKSPHSSPTGGRRGRSVVRGAPRGRGRLLGANAQEYPNITEPLHVDTTLVQEPDLRVPGPPPIVPSSCSPDVYDFNDTDSDGVGRGKKGKRGRKKGSSPKKNSKSPLDMAKSSISPRPREPASKSPRSPKFFSSSRSPISERNKEWMRSFSPPVRDLSKTLSETPPLEGNVAPSITGGPLAENSKSIQQPEEITVKDSQSDESQAGENAPKPDSNIISPRRSSRRNKTRDNQDFTPPDGKAIETMDSSLNSPSSGNSKDNTLLSGSVSCSAQNKEEKDEIAADMAASGSQLADSLVTPSNRIRKRGKRSIDHFQPDSSATQVGSIEEMQDISTAEEEPPKNTEDVSIKCSETPEAPPSHIASEELTNSSVDHVTKNSSPKSKSPKGKGKGRGKGKKKKGGKSPKGKGNQTKGIISIDTNVLPQETKQYQSVPDDAFDSSETSKPMEEKVNTHCVEKTNSQKNELGVPTATVHDTSLKPEDSPRKGRAKRGTVNLPVQNAMVALDMPSNGPTMETPLSYTTDETAPVIAQIEETESRGRRLRARRGSIKQDSKPETQDPTSEMQESKLETQELRHNTQEQRPEMKEQNSENQEPCPEDKEISPVIQASYADIKEIIPETLESKPELTESKPEAADVCQKLETPCPLPNTDINELEPSIISEQEVQENPPSLPGSEPGALVVPHGTDMDVDAETVENIAKFLEETASNIPGTAEESYADKRPKRSSRPPRKMDDNEMNDLLMLLNMEDEESEDEDYVPKDLENLDSAAESEDGVDSLCNDDDDDDDDDDDGLDYSGDELENEGRGGGNLSDLLRASDTAGDSNFVPTALKHGKGGTAKQKGLKKDKNKKVKTDTSSAKKGKVVKGKVKISKARSDDSELKKKSDDGKKKGDVGERRGPFIRLDKNGCREVIINTPYRDEDESERPMRKTNIQFYCKIEAKQKTAKVGYNSTLHNNYDAFSKDTSWYCSLCKNYSHSKKLGDLYGPYFIEGLTLVKKQHPQVVEGQVVESSSPSEVGKLKKRTQRRESTSEGPADTRKLELGGSSSPPWRFVPTATPARLLMIGVPQPCKAPPSQEVDLTSSRAGVAVGTNLHGGEEDPPSSNWSKDTHNI